MKISKHVGWIFLFVSLFIIYRMFFSLRVITGGDYLTRWDSQFRDLYKFAFLGWDNTVNLGWNIIFLLHYAIYNKLIGIFSIYISSNSAIVDRVFWWIPFFVCCIFSIAFVYKRLFTSRFTWLASFIFLFNTYILMIIGGGQIAGIGLAYSFVPLVLFTFISLIEKNTLKKSIFAAILLVFSILLDPREAYLIMICVVLYWTLFSFLSLQKKLNWIYIYLLKSIFFVFIFSVISAIFLHFFWIYPLLVGHQNPIQQLGTAYSTNNAVKYFSFANFENAFGLLHPHWPENIFGKTYFMKPEFLLLPFLAYASLLFIKKGQRNNMYILFFGLLGLVGTFLAKGANDPFGNIYLWCFQHIPGFNMFRDSSKWYLLVALSYSVLIPFTLSNIYTKVMGKK